MHAFTHRYTLLRNAPKPLNHFGVHKIVDYQKV